MACRFANWPLYAIVIRTSETSTSILSVRVSPDERAILEAAAEQLRTTLSDFMRRKALEAAEIDVFGRTVVTISAASWGQFEAWMREPAKEVPGLQELSRTKPSWSK
jgi:uncharacterized protein (DUF1778 family)